MTSTTSQVKELDERTLLVTIEGRPPGLLTNAIPPAVKENLLLKSEGKQSKAVSARSLDQQYEEALYHLDEPVGDASYGIKCDAFKQAMVRAAKTFKKLGGPQQKKLDGVQVQSLVFVGDGPDDLAPLIGDPEPRYDLISNSSGSKTAVTRAWFREWQAVLPMKFVAIVDQELLLQLLSDAGQGVGVGAWRRERGGHFGLWRIVSVA